MSECQPIRVAENQEGIAWRCAVCGFRDTIQVWPPHRACSRIQFDRIVPPPGPRGLGDSLAHWLSRIGIAQCKGWFGLAGGCAGRQAWLNRMVPYRKPQPFSIDTPDLLFHFFHGLGDAVQFTVVLAHLRALRPQWSVDVVTQRGVGGVFRGLCRQVFEQTASPRHYDLERHVEWWEPAEVWPDSPSTKAEKFLRQVLGITPRLELCRYQVQRSAADLQRAEHWLGTLGPRGQDGRFDVVAFHYQGTSSAANKNLDERAVREMVRLTRQAGYRPLLLDWDGRSTLGDPELPVFSASTEATQIAALIDRCRAFVGIDSGPGHLAGATDTPSLIVWRHHHPLHYYGLSPQVTHVVRRDHAQMLRGHQQAGLNFFRQHYRAIECPANQRHELPAIFADWLAGRLGEPAPLVEAAGHWIRRRWRENDAAIIAETHEQDCYRLARMNGWWGGRGPRTILDVGAHIGSFATAARVRWPAAQIVCVEPLAENVECLRRNAPWALVIEGAISYETGPLALLPSGAAGTTAAPSDCEVVAAGAISRLHPGDGRRHAPPRPVTARTVEATLDAVAWAAVDLLKLDCEGSEWGILAGVDPQRVRAIVGEYHGGAERLRRLAAERFPKWWLELEPKRGCDDGTFWLRSA